MKNILSFDIVNIHNDCPKIFTVRFDKEIVATRISIPTQETIHFEFSDRPGNHVLELALIDVPGSNAEIVVGNFKINHHECVDSKISSLFWVPGKDNGQFKGSLKGLVKFELLIDTPILPWQQKTRVY